MRGGRWRAGPDEADLAQGLVPFVPFDGRGSKRRKVLSPPVNLALETANAGLWGASRAWCGGQQNPQGPDEPPVVIASKTCPHRGHTWLPVLAKVPRPAGDWATGWLQPSRAWAHCGLSRPRLRGPCVLPGTSGGHLLLLLLSL